METTLPSFLSLVVNPDAFEINAGSLFTYFEKIYLAYAMMFYTTACRRFMEG
jgi:hypothetical protein